MSSTTNEAVYRRLIEEGFNQGNLAVVDELVAPDALEHQRGIGGGPEGVKGTIKYLRGAFPDFKITIEEVISVGDKPGSASAAAAPTSGLSTATLRQGGMPSPM